MRLLKLSDKEKILEAAIGKKGHLTFRGES
jgi:hypothetical protein